MTARAEATTMVMRCPCDSCSHFVRCKQESLACSRYRYFYRTGDVRPDLYTYPTRDIYLNTLG